MLIVINATRQPVTLNWRLAADKRNRDLVRPFQLGAGRQAHLPPEWGEDEHMRFVDHHATHYGMKKITETDAITAHDGLYYFERMARPEQIIEAIEVRDDKRDAEAMDMISAQAIAFDHQVRHLAEDPSQEVGAKQSSMKVTSEIDPADPEPATVINREIVPTPAPRRGR